MKKKRKVWGMVCLCALICLGLGGCMRVTKEILLTKMAANMLKTESYRMKLSLDTKLNLDAGGFQMDTRIGGDFDMDVTRKPQASYLNGTLNLEAIGQKIDLNLEMYSLQSDEEVEIYSKVNTLRNDTGWIRTTAEDCNRNLSENLDLLKSFQVGSIEKLLENVSLSKETVEIDGVECYEIIGTETGDVIEPWIEYFVENMSDTLGNEGEAFLKTIDWAKLNVPLKLYIDKKEKRPVKIMLDLTDSMNCMMTDSMEEALKEADLPESLDFEVNVDTCEIEMHFYSYGEVGTITVPADVKAGAKTAE